MCAMSSRPARGLIFIIRNRVKLVLQTILSEESFRKIYSKPDDFLRKALARKMLNEAMSELKAGAHRHGISASKEMDTWGPSDFDALTETQLMDLAEARFKGSSRIAADKALAMEAWKAASRRGNINATYSMAVCLRDGQGVTKDVDEAFRLLLPLAEAYNHSYAHYSCAVMLLNGEGTEVNHKEAFKHFQIAARMGIPPAAHNMANMYSMGLGTPQNDENAFICYEIAAEAGDANAKYILGQWLCEGRGTKKNLSRGMELLKNVSHEGNARAAHTLGMMYLTGNDVDANPQEGIYWLSVAARMGFFHSMFNLAVMHKEGDFGMATNLNKAEELFAECCLIDPNNRLSAELLEETRRLISQVQKK